MKSKTQDMKYRYSLMKYCEKYGVSRASRKYNKSRSYIYFWKKRFDGTMESLSCQSRRPHHHPNQHTEEELTLIRNVHRRNPKTAYRHKPSSFREAKATIDSYINFYNNERIQTEFGVAPFSLRHSV